MDHSEEGRSEAATRIIAACHLADTVGIPLVINARIDVYSKNVGDARTCFDETIRRAKAYLAAGADYLFPFGLYDVAILSELIQELAAPVNVIGRPGMATLDQLSRIGVARVSTASGPTLASIDMIREIAEQLRRTGKFDVLQCNTTRSEVQRLLVRTDN